MITQPTPPETLWLEAGELLEAPFLLATQWWLMAAGSPAGAHKPHARLGDHHLVVPEPIDAASEPGLFA